MLVSGSGAMSPLEKMSDEDFERHALAVLQRELGLDGLARFLRLYRSGSGDYTRDRHRWLEGATVHEIMAEVERLDKPAAQPPHYRSTRATRNRCWQPYIASPRMTSCGARWPSPARPARLTSPGASRRRPRSKRQEPSSARTASGYAPA